MNFPFPSKVLVQKIPEYDAEKVRSFLEQAFSLICPDKRIKAGDRVLVKPNFLWPKPAETAVCTHPVVIMESCKILKEMGARISIGDSPSRGSAEMVVKKLGIDELARGMGIEVRNFVSPLIVDVREPIRFRTLELAREALEFEHIINLAKFKTHDLMILTLSVKNMFGCVVGKRKPLYHLETEHNIRAFAELHLEIYRYLKPVLSVMDAIVGMEGNGPNTGDVRKMGMMLASTDAVALDSVCGAVVNFPFSYNLTAFLGNEHKIGRGDLKDIEVIGPGLEELRIHDFKFPHPGPPESGKISAVVRWFIGDGFVRRPVFDHNRCTRCGICIDTCPSKALFLKEARRREGGFEQKVEINRDKCIHCFCCQEVCPEGAIKSEKSWLARKLLG